MASPPGQCTHPHHKGEGIFCPHAPAITKVAITHLGGTAARSSSTPSFLLESLEKVCSSWACHPSSHYLSFRPIEALYKLPVLSWAGWGGSTVQVSGQPHRTMCTVRASAEPTPHPLQVLIHQPPPQGEQVCISYFLDTPRREPLMGHTHHHGRHPRGTLG